jgi:hypothetical protein
MRRALTVLVREGPRSFAIRLLSRLGIYRRLLLAWVDKPPVMEATVPLEISVLEETEVEELVESIPVVPESEVRARLSGLNFCFVARHEGRLVHATWALTTRAWSDFLGCDLELEPGEALVCDAYTVTEARGHRILSAVGSWLGRYLYEFEHPRRSEYQRVVSAFFPENRAALKLIEAAGFHPDRWQGFVKVGPWRRDFSQPAKGAD